ncbi:hypothetical protein KAU93_05025, partial [Candidatus Bathyarchaeota archaeon]|nr:hypothetical protein [Candidatus Bathyarchaeota archaeon]
MELDRLNERVTASNVNYTGSGGTISVQVVLENNGQLAVRITTLWVLDATAKRYGFNNTLDLNLKPGNKTYLTGGNAVDVNIAGANATDTFNSWFVTARGNVVPLEEEQSVIVAHLSQGIGSMAMDFNKFKYFLYTGDKLANYPTGNINFTVPSGDFVAFGVCLTNLDPLKQTIVINKFSQLWIYSPSVGSNQQWFIVNVAPDGSINSPYSDISIGYAETK